MKNISQLKLEMAVAKERMEAARGIAEAEGRAADSWMGAGKVWIGDEEVRKAYEVAFDEILKRELKMEGFWS